MYTLGRGVDVDWLVGYAVLAQTQGVVGMRVQLLGALLGLGMIDELVREKYQIEQAGEAGPEIVAARARESIVVAADGQPGSEIVALGGHVDDRWRKEQGERRRKRISPAAFSLLPAPSSCMRV